MPDLDYHSFQLSFNSDNHDAGSNDEPVFYVRPEINNIVGMEYISGSATFTYYVTAAPYNTLQINRNGAGLVTLTVDEGNYNSTTMVTALGEALTNASLGSIYTIAFSLVTNKTYIIDQSGTPRTFAVRFATDSMSDQLGFVVNTTYTATLAASTFSIGDITIPTGSYYLESPLVYNLTGPSTIFVHTDALQQNYEGTYRRDGKADTDVVGKITVNQNPGGILSYEEVVPMTIPIQIHTLGSAKFYCTLGNRRTPLRFNGGNFTTDIRVFKPNATDVQYQSNAYGQGYLSIRGSAADRSDQAAVGRRKA